MKVDEFLERWRHAGPAERANKDLFLVELCRVLAVEEPLPKTNDAEKDRYVFEKDVARSREDGTSIGRIDLYRAGSFVLEAKQVDAAKRESASWHQAMNDALGQALGYARSLPSPPPFVMVCDIGYCFDLYASFDGSGAYRPFPDGFRKRLYLTDLERHSETLRKLWLDPLELDPSRQQAKITREVAAKIAALARELEAAQHDPQVVAEFLMRCLFTMFAEDVGLLPQKLFSKYLREYWLPNPATFPGGVGSLWRDMNEGRETPAGKLLRFNGGLFAESRALPLTKKQLELLAEAAQSDWAAVDPSIFGTLLERALSPTERHRLGAHYTPRAYVERLVKPTIEEPLRADWDLVRAEVRQLVEAAGLDEENASVARTEMGRIHPERLDAGSMTTVDADRTKAAFRELKAQEADAERAGVRKLESAQQRVVEFHRSLCRVRVLDPACGTGNFLYVTLDLFKRLESEVLAFLEGLGYGNMALEMEKFRVTPEQFRGIEVKPWAKEIAELVLWIGYLQWQVKQSGEATTVPEPVLRDYGNIECRDAVLAWDGDPELARDEHGVPISRWDGTTMKKSPVTSEDVPDDTARNPVWIYNNPRPAEWPSADFIIGNPPFIGTKRMRGSLGDGYVDALRLAYGERVEENADYVMYWWYKAALVTEGGSCRRFGLISTNSISQAFNRRVVQRALEAGLSIPWAIPDHPWTDGESGAAVRIAMTCGSAISTQARLLKVVDETPQLAFHDGASRVVLEESQAARVSADLKSGTSTSLAGALTANSGLAAMGVALHGAGFTLDMEEVTRVGGAGAPAIASFVSGRDLAGEERVRYVIDFSGLNEDEARQRNAAAFQRVVDRVLPERRLNRRESIKRLWWRFGWERPELRRALKGCTRFIATPETAKHRAFQFIPAGFVPEHKLVVIAHDDAQILGELSSRPHLVWALASGGQLGPTPVYSKTRCFDPFPFPVCNLQNAERIRSLAEQLDGHRKRQQGLHAGLTITGMYNVLEKLRSGEALTAKEKGIHEQGLVSVLKQIHDELDAAVFAAYGWPVTLSDEEILERLVALNQERAEEEKNGLVRWLRPEFQNPQGKKEAAQVELPGAAPGKAKKSAKPERVEKRAWPKELPQQVAAVRDLLGGAGAIDLAGAKAAFKGAKDEALSSSLDSLAALGLAVASGAGPTRTWSAVR